MLSLVSKHIFATVTTALLFAGCGGSTPQVADGQLPYFFPAGSKIYVKDISQIKKMDSERWKELPEKLKSSYPQAKLVEGNKIDLGVDIDRKSLKGAYRNLVNADPFYAAFPVLLSGGTFVNKARIFPYDMDDYEDYCTEIDERIIDEMEDYYTVVNKPEEADYSIFLQVTGCGTATPNRIVYPLEVNADNWQKVSVSERISSGLGTGVLGHTLGGIGGGLVGGVWGMVFADNTEMFFAQQVIVTDSSDQVMINKMVQAHQRKFKYSGLLKNNIETQVLKVLHDGPTTAVATKK